MRISTKTHAVLDCAAIAFTLAFPRLLGAGRRMQRGATALAIARLGYTLLTRHEAGVAKLLPMKAHLQLDGVAAVTLGALSLAGGREQKRVIACAIGLGLADLALSQITETDPRSQTGPAGEPTASGAGPRSGGLPGASLADWLAVYGGVIAPNALKGPILRRPQFMALGERIGADRLGIRTLQWLRAKYGRGPVMLATPGHWQAVVLDPEDALRILNESPEPFATTTLEKRAALAHFEPDMALVSHGAERAARRQLLDETLQNDHPEHPLQARFRAVVDDEAERLLTGAVGRGSLTWREFRDGWFCMARRVLLGDAARDDRPLSNLTDRLRANANWLFFWPRRADLRNQLHGRLKEYLARQEPGSLAAMMAAHVRSPQQTPENQLAHPLFAFDAAAMGVFRALALLAAHPRAMERARKEVRADPDSNAEPRWPLLRSTILEAFRLWPTTPLLLRQTTRPVPFRGGVMPEKTTVLIFEPFFHRDPERIPFANAFRPDIWESAGPVTGLPPDGYPFFPFSAGPANCAGRSVALELMTSMLGALVRDHEFRLPSEHTLIPGALPSTQNHAGLRFAVQRADVAVGIGG